MFYCISRVSKTNFPMHLLLTVKMVRLSFPGNFILQHLQWLHSSVASHTSYYSGGITEAQTFPIAGSMMTRVTVYVIKKNLIFSS